MMEQKSLTYDELLSAFNGGLMEDYEWFDNGFTIINPATSDLYFLADSKKALHILDYAGRICCIKQSDFYDMPVDKYLRGMTFDELTLPSNLEIICRDDSILVKWSIDVFDRTDYANLHLEDTEEPYLNDREYECWAGDEVHCIDPNKFPYFVDIDFSMELDFDGIIVEGPKLYITRRIHDEQIPPGTKLNYNKIKATYSVSKGVYDVQKI